MPAGEPPYLLCALLCDAVRQEPDGSRTVVGIRSQLVLTTPPATETQPLHLLVILFGLTEGEHRLLVSTQPTASGRDWIHPVPFRVGSGTPLSILDIETPIPVGPSVPPDTVVFYQLVLDGGPLTVVPIQVVQRFTE